MPSLSRWTLPGGLKEVLSSGTIEDDPGFLTREVRISPAFWVPRETYGLCVQELEYYLSQFRQGMNGPLNYYRTTRLRFDEEHSQYTCRPRYTLILTSLSQGGTLLPVPSPDLPVLLIVGKEDPTSNQAALGMNKMLIPQIQIEVLEGVGHWVMVQSKDLIIEGVARFLQGAGLNSVQTKL